MRTAATRPAPKLRQAASVCAALAIAACAHASEPVPAGPRNVVIFVADGLRYGSVNETDAPALAALRAEGVDFGNSHALFPTVTTPNASAIATGHYLGDTGDFANTIYPGDGGFLPDASFSRLVSYEDDPILRNMNARFGGNYLHETSLLAMARRAGYATAALGKTGPSGVQDLAALEGADGIVIDDTTGADGPALSAPLAAALSAAKLQLAPPPPALASRSRLDWFVSIATDVLLPRFKAAHKPFVLIVWSPDPDATQHAQRDSLDTLTPGVNGPTSRAAIKNVSDALARLRAALHAQGLEDTTDIVVTADHGFATVARRSQTSPSTRMKFRDWPAGQLPPGFLALDLAGALSLKAFEPNGLDVQDGLPPRRGSAMLGADFEHPSVLIGANGAADMIWLPGPDASALARRIVAFLTTQDYVAALFVDDALGQPPGSLPLSAVRLKGAALTPVPAIIVSFRSFSTGCADPELCAAVIADTSYREGGGIHGSFSRAETRNFMAAAGPDFKSHFVDPTPVSNADWTPTLAKILNLQTAPVGVLTGRVMSEALRGGGAVAFSADTRVSAPAANGFQTKLDFQRAGGAEYYDAAGAPGRAVGLKP